MTFKRYLSEVDLVKVLPQLTALWCLLNLSEKGFEYIPLKVMALVILILPAMTYKRGAWILFTFTYSLYLASNYVIADNHRWLFLYWMIGLTLSLGQGQGSLNFKEGLNKCSRYLIIVTFLLASLWKLFNYNYLNGSFFEFILAGGDNRLQDFVILALGYLPSEIKYNTYLIQNYLVDASVEPYNNTLIITDGLRAMAKVFTYYALWIEVALVALFLGSVRRFALRKYASYLLLVFILSVYFITPVYGFGQLLALMGMATSEEKQVENYFFATFLLMIVLDAPWGYFLVS